MPLSPDNSLNDSPITVRAGSNGQVSSRAAVEGDTVIVHFTVFGERGEYMESTRDAGQPLTFEVGSSEVIGSELLQAFDCGVRGLSVGKAPVDNSF